MVITLLFTLLLSQFANAVENTKAPLKQKQAFVTMSYHNMRDSLWMYKRCKLIFDTLETVKTLEHQQGCVDLYSGEEENSRDVIEAKKSNQYSYWIQFIQKENGSEQLKITNWKKESVSDIGTIGWDIEKDKMSDLAIQKLLVNFLQFDVHKRDIQRAYLNKGINESKKIKIDENGNYLDLSTRQTVDFQTAYMVFVTENQRQGSFIKAGMEISALLAWWAYRYWAPHAEDNVNAVDWQFPTGQVSARARYKTGAAYRFDDNAFGTNLSHVGAGIGYYMVSRSNGNSRLESLLFSITSSSVWEYFVEYREVVSINDQINTGIGGAIIGETIYEMGKLLRYHVRTGKANWFDKVLATIFNGPEKLNMRYGKSRATDFRDFGFDPKIWSKFDLALTIDSLQGDMPGDLANQKKSTHKKFGIDAQIVGIPMYEEAGEVSMLLTDNVFSQLLVESTMNDNMKKQFLFYAQTVLAAYYKKDLHKDENGELRGYNFFVGPSVSFNYEDSSDSTNKLEYEEFTQVRILGTTIDLVMYYKGVRLRATLDVFGDFAMMRSYAFDKYKVDNDISKLQSVMRKYGYYYGMGSTVQAKVSAQYKRAEIGSSYQKWHASIIHGRSRFYETDTDMTDFSDERKKFQVWVTYRLTDHLKLQYRVDRIHRSGAVENFGSFGSSEKHQLFSIIYTIK